MSRRATGPAPVRYSSRPEFAELASGASASTCSGVQVVDMMIHD